ncbi:MAG: MFS transporter [Acholeplasmataceae bacterium]
MKKTIYLIIAFTFTQGVIHNLGHPVTPAFVRSLGIEDYMFGVFFATMSFGLMLGGPIWGVLSDQGKKKVYIVTGLLIYSVGQIGFGYANNQVLMVFFRFLSGFGVVSSLTLFTSHIIEISKIDQRAKHLAYMAASFTLGSSMGYFIGGFISTNVQIASFLGTSDYKVMFLYQAILNVLYAGVIVLLLKEARTQNVFDKKPSVIEGLKNISKMPTRLLLFFISLTLMTIGSINLSKYIDVYFDELGYNPQELGTFVMATGFVSLFASIFFVPIFAKYKKQLWVIAVIQTLSALIVFYVFRANGFIIMMYTVYMVYVIFKTIYQPLEQNYIATFAQHGSYGGIMGLRQSFVSIGMVIGPLIGGFLYETRPLLLFDFSAIALLIGVLLLIVVHFSALKEQKNIT